MGFGLSSLFGGSKSSSKQDPAKVWGEQTPYFKDIYSNAQNTFNSAQQSPYTNQAWEGMSDYAQGDQLNGMVGNSQNALNFALNPYSGFMNPAFDGMMNKAIRPVMQNFQENVLPSIGRNSMMTGGYGGSRQGIAEGIATRGLNDTMGDISSSMVNNAYNQGLNSMMSGLGLAPSIGQFGQMPSNLLSQIGQQQEAQPWQNLSRYKSIMGNPTVLSGGGTSTGSSQGGIGDMFGFNFTKAV